MKLDQALEVLSGQPIFIVICFIMGFAFFWLLSQLLHYMVNKWIQKRVDERDKEKEEKNKKIQEAIELNKATAEASIIALSNIFKTIYYNCVGHGFIDSESAFEFMQTAHAYEKVGGNTILNIYVKKFMDLPLLDTVKIPKEKGSDIKVKYEQISELANSYLRVNNELKGSKDG